jgi:DNA modification methylase
VLQNDDRVTVSLVPLEQLTPAPWNPRHIDKNRLKNLAESIKADPNFLLRRPILAQQSGEIYAGNQRWHAAKLLFSQGWTPPWETQTLPADLDDVPDQLARERALRDNNAWGAWDDDSLARLLGDLRDAGSDTGLLGFDDRELSQLLSRLGDGRELHPDDADLTPPVDPITKPGDLWILGDHRLLCGDATDSGDVERLMDGQRAALIMTDPPYGVEYSEIVESRENQKAGGWAPLQGDVATNLADWLPSAFQHAATIATTDDAAWFCWHPPGANAALFRAALESAGVGVHKQIMWSKPHFVFGRWEYHWQHEPAMYGWRKHPPFYGDRSESTVWAVEHEGGIKTRNGPAMPSLGLGEHPTQKPPELWARAMRNHTLLDAVVYDPFAGSGPCVTAAEQHTRRAYVMDIEPAYCDVIVRRWERVSGRQAYKKNA